jgi:hypothetical protein
MIYGIVCIALIKLRRTKSADDSYYKIPYGKLLAVSGFLVAIWLLTSSKLNEIRDVTIAASAGLIIYFLVEYQKRIAKPDK